MITGITPQLAQARGVTEAEFARRIHALFTVENTCVVGYNNVRFDDEVTRNIFIATFTIPTPGAGRTAIRAGICWMSCAPATRCVPTASTGQKMMRGCQALSWSS